MTVAFGTLPANLTATWQPEPNVRGTWSLLFSCIITIGLCAWTALHLNIPEHNRSGRERLRKLKWLLLGLLAPETVAYIAWCQRQEAVQLASDVRACYGQRKPVSRLKRLWVRWIHGKIAARKIEPQPPVSLHMPEDRSARPVWTLVHGFYACMGGFAFASGDEAGTTSSSSSGHSTIFPGGRARAAITPEGLRWLLQYRADVLPAITEEQIKDKSKADGVKKAFVCTQALWFGVLVISRLAQHLPISLLELNAFAHALCTFVIYAMWWEKPLDVEEPTLIAIQGCGAPFSHSCSSNSSEGGAEEAERMEHQQRDLAGLAAVMWMSSSISKSPFQDWDLTPRLRNEFDAIWPTEPVPNFQDLLLHDPQPRTASPARPDPPAPFDLYPQFPSPSRRRQRHLRDSIPSSSAHSALRWSCLRSLDSLIHLHFSSFSTATIAESNDSIIDNLPPAAAAAPDTPPQPLSLDLTARRTLAHAAITTHELQADLRTRHARRGNIWQDHDRVKARVPEYLAVISAPMPGGPSSLSSVEAGHGPGDGGSFLRKGYIGFLLAGLLYGGIHLLAWDAPFVTTGEKWAWRVAGLAVVGVGIALAPVVGGFEAAVAGARRVVMFCRRGRARTRKVSPVSRFGWASGAVEVVLAGYYALVLVLAPLLGASYVFGRVYLVAAALRQVVVAPGGVWVDVSWPGYIPHVG